MRAGPAPLRQASGEWRIDALLDYLRRSKGSRAADKHLMRSIPLLASHSRAAKHQRVSPEAKLPRQTGQEHVLAQQLERAIHSEE